MTTSTDGSRPSVAPEPDGEPGPPGDSGPRRRPEPQEHDDTDEAADGGPSSWVLREIQRRVEHGSGSSAKHARRDTVLSPGTAEYVPRHSTAMPGPGAPRPKGGAPSPHATQLLRRERAESQTGQVGANGAVVWSTPVGRQAETSAPVPPVASAPPESSAVPSVTAPAPAPQEAPQEEPDTAPAAPDAAATGEAVAEPASAPGDERAARTTPVAARPRPGADVPARAVPDEQPGDDRPDGVEASAEAAGADSAGATVTVEPPSAVELTAPTAPVLPAAKITARPVLGDPVFTARTPEPGSPEWKHIGSARVPQQRTESDANDLQSRRVRVVLAERRGVARPVRTVVEMQEGTGVGEFLRNDLIKTQLSIALRFAAGAALILGLLPLLFAMFPEVGRIDILGFRLPWLLLGLLVYPFLFGIGLWHSRLAEKVEQNFADHVQD